MQPSYFSLISGIDFLHRIITMPLILGIKLFPSYIEWFISELDGLD